MAEEKTMEERMLAVETALANLAKRIDEFPRGISPDDLNNATHPMADEITSLRAEVKTLAESLSALPKEILDTLSSGDASRNAWIDAVLNRYHYGDKPS